MANIRTLDTLGIIQSEAASTAPQLVFRDNQWFELGNPEPLTHEKAGISLRQSGRYQESIVPLLRAITTYPYDNNLKCNLSYVYFQLGMRKEALEISEYLIKKSPNNPVYILFHARNLVGPVSEQHVDNEEALIYLDRIIPKLSPSDDFETYIGCKKERTQATDHLLQSSNIYGHSAPSVQQWQPAQIPTISIHPAAKSQDVLLREDKLTELLDLASKSINIARQAEEIRDNALLETIDALTQAQTLDPHNTELMQKLSRFKNIPLDSVKSAILKKPRKHHHIESTKQSTHTFAPNATQYPISSYSISPTVTPQSEQFYPAFSSSPVVPEPQGKDKLPSISSLLPDHFLKPKRILKSPLQRITSYAANVPTHDTSSSFAERIYGSKRKRTEEVDEDVPNQHTKSVRRMD